MGETMDNFINQIESYGLGVRVVSIDHIEELQSEIEYTKSVYEDININIGKYLDRFTFKVPDGLSAKSIIVIAVPQPITRIHFTLGTKIHTVIIPPTYLMYTDNESDEKQNGLAWTSSTLEKILFQEGFKVVKTILPGKLIAVNSGLGVYGKNNICYINGQSSYYWIGVYISDMPCENDSWNRYSTMDMCKNCDLCIRNCPTGAISNDRFILHANKCITLLNESSEDFPLWLKPNWHNSLIGCMRCQACCPANRNHIANVVDTVEFDDADTKMLLAKIPLNQLPEYTFRKLKSINFIEDYSLLARNLSVLISD